MAYKGTGYDSEAPDEFEPIPVGKYGTACDGVELKYGKDSGEPYVSWTWVVVDGDHKNRNVWNNTSLQKKSMNMPGGFWKSMVACIGSEATEEFSEQVTDGDFEDEETMVEAAAELCISRLATVGVTQRTFEGRVQSDVIMVKPYEGDQPQLDTEELAAQGKTPKKGKKGKKRTKKSSKDDSNF